MRFKAFRNHLCIGLMAAAILLLSHLSHAAYLDPTFDNDGWQSIDVGQSKLDLHDNTNAMALQGDGKVVLVGYVSVNGTSHFGVTRLNTDGTLDTTFNHTGKLFLPVGVTHSFATGVAVQSNGKIVVSGNASTADTDTIAVVRFNSDGSLDTSFGDDGKQFLPIVGRYAYGRAMALQGDGKILVAGEVYDWPQKDFAVVRFNANGSLDTTFNNDGLRTIPFAGDFVLAKKVALFSDGRIVVAGDFYNGSDFLIALIRLNPDGSFDTTFNGSGQLVLSQSQGRAVTGLAVSSNKILVGVEDNSAGYQLSVLRFNDDGSPDATFGEDGKASTSFNGNYVTPQHLALQSDGKIVVAGVSDDGDRYALAVARFNTDGSLDTSLHGDGHVTRRLQGGLNSGTGSNALAVQSDNKMVFAVNGGFSTLRLNANGSLDTGFLHEVPFYAQIGGSYDAAQDMVLQSNGKSIVVGFVDNGLQHDFGITRLNLDGSLDSSFAGTGKKVVSLSAGDDDPSAVTLQSDGKIVVVGTSVVDTSRADYVTDFAIVRLNPNGTLDTSFAGGGRLILPMLSKQSWAQAVTVQSDGKIVVVGGSRKPDPDSYDYDFVIARLNANGSLDTTFSGDGKLRLFLPSSNSATSVATDVVVQKNGSIVVVGRAGSHKEFVIVRLKANGSFDPTFSGDGKLMLPVNTNEAQAENVALQRDGKIVVSGPAFQGGSAIAVVRLQSNGSLDTTFSGDGKLSLFVGGDYYYPTDMVLQPDDKMVFLMEGTTVTDDGWYYQAGSVFRVNADGSTDNTFDGDGKFLFTIGGVDTELCAVAVQNDGKIVVAGDGYYPGYNYSGSSYDFFVSRIVPQDAQVFISNARTVEEGSTAEPGSALFPVTLGEAYPQPVTVSYETVDGTAKAGRDYVASAGMLTFATGETTQYVRVNFIGDSVPELSETFFLDLKNPTNGTLIDRRGVGTIRNDDGPSLSIANAIPTNEGKSSLTPQAFMVSLSAASADTITVAWTTADDTAGPDDYMAASGVLTFAPGETSKLILVQLKGDTTIEPDETYKVNLSKPTYAVIADGQGLGAIRNDDIEALNFGADEPSE